MNVLELLRGKTMKVMTEVKVEVELTIDKVTVNYHSEELEPSTSANDWWPKSRDWETYTVHFTNGSTKQFNSLNELNVI